MKVSWCAPALPLAALVACSTPTARPAIPAARPEVRQDIRIQVIERGRPAIRTIGFEQYVAAAILSEFAPAAGDIGVVERMFEVQAVVSRTYALAHSGRHGREGFDLCSTTHCQLFDPSRLRTSRWATASEEAVRKTAGEVLVYGGAPADTLFHADCGGRTSTPPSVWGGAGLPYLPSAVDDGPAEAAHTAWRYEVGRDALLRALNVDPRTRAGDRLDSIEVLERDPAGRAELVALHGRRESIVRGEALREVLNRNLGARTVRSTWFDVERRGLTFVFSGRGFGHGVGLCQAGALARLRAGEKLQAVLQHYFPGTKLVAMAN